MPLSDEAKVILRLLKCADCGLSFSQLQQKAAAENVSPCLRPTRELITRGLARIDPGRYHRPTRVKATPFAWSEVQADVTG